MYLECRHIHPSGESCHAAALKTSPFCYYHDRFHERQRRLARIYNVRDAQGRFVPKARAHHPAAAQPPAAAHGPLDRPALPAPDPEAPTATLDYGAIPVGDPAPPPPPGPADLPLDLAPVEDAASVQLALIDVLGALARQELDPKRAGLLLYGLQVASANVRNVRVHRTSVRELSYSEDGVPLAPEEYAMDIDDFNALSEQEDAELDAENDDEEYED